MGGRGASAERKMKKETVAFGQQKVRPDNFQAMKAVLNSTRSRAGKKEGVLGEGIFARPHGFSVKYIRIFSNTLSD